MRKRQPNTESILYYPVAQVAAADLTEVFRLTQLCNQLSKADLAQVQWETDHHRSMMVGDLVENDSGIYRCWPSGWQQI